MPVTLSVLAVGVIAGVALSLVAKTTKGSVDVDPERQEDRAVAAAAGSSVVVGFVRSLGRRAAGSALIAVGLVVVLALAVFAGSMLDMVNSSSGFARFDASVAQWGADHATARSTQILGLITHLGSSVVAILASSIVAVIDWRRRHNRDALWFLVVTYAGHAIISNVLKFVVERHRPPVEHLVGTVSSSFPSTHSGTAAAVWAAIALVLGAQRSVRVRAVLAVGVTVIGGSVAASRALLGVHWLTDVVAGVAIGWGWFLLVAIAFGGRRLRLGEPAERLEVESITRERVDGSIRGGMK